MRSPDPGTRATRDAASWAAASVVAFAGLWLLSTQVADVRAASRFADDPWDAVMSYAAIFLPFVAGPTWIRSLAHREPVLRPTTARRIRWGSGLAAAIVLAACLADLGAIVVSGVAADRGAVGAGLAALVIVTALLATTAALRVARVPAGPAVAVIGGTFEPDIVDDLVALAAQASGRFGVGRSVVRLGDGLERFLDTSPSSPRRHRLAFGVVLAFGAAAAFDVWHAIREGPWSSATVPLVFGGLIASGVLAIYVGTVGPLRILRQADAPE